MLHSFKTYLYKKVLILNNNYDKLILIRQVIKMKKNEYFNEIEKIYKEMNTHFKERLKEFLLGISVLNQLF